MKYQFKYYLHDNDGFYENADWVAERENIPVEVVRECADTRPFYEITVYCEYDTETKQTTILKAE